MANKGKTILILGNGFDLAHGLPTRYSDFLEFCQRIERIWTYGQDKSEQTIARFKQKCIDEWKTEESVREAIVEAFRNRRIEMKDGICEISTDNQALLEIHNLLDDNVWYEYFRSIYESNLIKGENWIDFESEIRYLIKKVDYQSPLLTKRWYDVVKEFNEPLSDSKLKLFVEKLKFEKYIHKKNLSSIDVVTIRDFREKTYEDLERLTRALELYLVNYVEKIEISKEISVISYLIPDYVINFNYTNTYERVYNKGKVYHIHGKADAKHSVEDNNMVLGIDEYWKKEKRDTRTNFTIFKKFSQRIQKRTGNESYVYLEEIRRVFKENGATWTGGVDITKVHPNNVSHIYVFGHSLDVTDKDILSDFIGDDSTSVTVYCRDKGTEGELIANTIKLIGEKKLIKKANCVPVKLDFVIPKE